LISALSAGFFTAGGGGFGASAVPSPITLSKMSSKFIAAGRNGHGALIFVGRGWQEAKGETFSRTMLSQLLQKISFFHAPSHLVSP
jgi:hypothetical protein